MELWLPAKYSTACVGLIVWIRKVKESTIGRKEERKEGGSWMALRKAFSAELQSHSMIPLRLIVNDTSLQIIVYAISCIIK